MSDDAAGEAAAGVEGESGPAKGGDAAAGGVAPAAGPAGDPTAGVDAAAAALGRARAAARAKGLRPGVRAPRRRGVPGTGPGFPRAAGRDPALIGGMVEKLLAERGWSAPIAVGAVIGRWREVVGDEIADHAEPETFTEGRLVVRTTSTAWATQLRLLLPQLSRRLAEEVGEGVVEEIVVLGPGAPSWIKGPRVVRGRGPRDTYG